ncbi:helix-turn-helix domain-containing protein [Clostridium sporogenes]|uniref:helix-turn-helix domain-containing protein n=1 Tax=Clostridium sporogenes TaxID=1509 RepID=UPI0013D74E5F|nr:helix-turn-helix domain-containing protein [Clostridium sporogenes]MCW6079013.1 replication initiation and membrane attachment [Clostridium sporogenes]NFG96819.1 replication initiation and membrane attachment [Clostridium sporogenes]NFH33259.1 replication initiation and membrane attachment [Clostridium sporogenes]NFL20156.1 replication initiation and membrane attachment [Clostridium sporogenes]NFN71750.1 replication initiation and membrane attachment [Clostridium sporogenes]
MAVFRVIKDKENPYVMLNKYFVYDGRLSLKAKGLMSYFLSRPDNWEFYSSEIEKNCKDGEKAIRTAIKELETNGYIERLLKRDSNGKLIGGYDYTIYEIPQNIKSDETTCTKGEPKRQNAYSAKCLSGETPIRRNGGLLNNDIKLNKERERDSHFEAMKLCQYVEQVTSMPGILNLAAVKISIMKHGYKHTKLAIEKAIALNKCSMQYINGILQTWMKEGYPKEDKKEQQIKTNSCAHKEFDFGGDIL